jgi:DNA-binding XRE family transcriptional regulator
MGKIKVLDYNQMHVHLADIRRENFRKRSTVCREANLAAATVTSIEKGGSVTVATMAEYLAAIKAWLVVKYDEGHFGETVLTFGPVPRYGWAIQRYRRQQSLSQDFIAEKASISRRTLVSLEAGKSGRFNNLLAVIEAVGLELYIHYEEERDFSGAHGALPS